MKPLALYKKENFKECAKLDFKKAKSEGVSKFVKEIPGLDSEILLQLYEDDPRLVKLYLYNKKIGDEGAAALSQALAINSSLRSIDLCYNNIRAEGARALSQVIVLCVYVFVVKKHSYTQRTFYKL